MKKLSAFAALILCACAIDGTDTWRDIGSIENGNILVAYDSGSLRREGDIATLRERKTIRNAAKHDFHGLPPYHKAVSEWEFNCKKRSFRLVASTLTDNNGAIVTQQRYTAATLPARSVPAGSLTEKQLQTACK